MSAAAGPIRVPGLGRAQAIDWRHPEWWLVPVVFAGWLVVVALALARGSAESAPGPVRGYAALFSCPIVAPAGTLPPASPADLRPVLSDAAESAAMVTAMMGLLTLPVLHHVGLTAPWSRRRRAPLLVLLAYLVTWLPVVLALDLVVRSAAGAFGSLPVVGAAVAAALLWQRTSWRRRAVRRCAVTVPLPAWGWRADAASLRLGASVGRSCVAACAGPMLVLAAAGHAPIAMAAVAAALVWERTAARPRSLPGALTTLAVGAVAAVGAGWQ